MTEEFVERRQCAEHSGEYARSCMNMANIDQIKANCQNNVESLYAAISKKTPLWTFLPLVAVLLSILTLQWTMFEKMTYMQASMSDKMAEMHKTMAVLEYRVGNMK